VAAGDLERFAERLYVAAGVDADKASVVARLQVLTDAMGRRTHGVAMAPLYLAELGKGTMRASGDVTLVSDNGIVAVWDGEYLPGLWVVDKAIAEGIPRARQHGIAAYAIRRSHHIGCLAALSKRAADEGMVAMVVNSDPAGKRVAPYGGTEPLLTPNPFALAYPGGHHPVLIDTCASITTTSMTRQKYAEGRQFEHPWLIDADGNPTRDPAVLENTEPPGSLLPIGGLEYGHKGFGLGLMVEALSQGLSGQGRSDPPTQWTGSTYLQVMDPERFAGLDRFTHEMDYLSDTCRTSRPIDPKTPVRIPGDAAARGIAESAAKGIEVDEATMKAIAPWAEKLKIAMPWTEDRGRRTEDRTWG
jgi:LDH2 family malate/lactate/ureidoglycolate dehydrogenase